MITIPTTEMIGGLTDVLPIITDDKGSLAGVKVEWDGGALHFSAYDVFAGGTVRWTPGEGAEGEVDDETDDDTPWGATDSETPWATWIYLDSAKEILKLFKLPAKLWRTPVTVKCSLNRDRLIVERTDSPRGERLLSIPADPDQLRHIPDIREISMAADERLIAQEGIRFAGFRLGAFGSVRAHGVLRMAFGPVDQPVGIQIGSRYYGFVYPAGAEGVRPYNALRDGAGVAS
jgi:hypothetical protein